MNKPVVKLYIDDYARETGNIYTCSYSNICARGKTHAEAFNELRDHFKLLRSPRPVPTLTIMC